VLDTKAVPARGGGIVRYRQQVRNQRDEMVMEYEVARLIRCEQPMNEEKK
jgi:acyl dehydratase